MLRESSISTATTFCCGMAALTTSVGRKRQKTTRPSAAMRSTVSTKRSRGRPLVPTVRYVKMAAPMMSAAMPAATKEAVVMSKRKSPCWKTTGRYENSAWKIFSNTGNS